ncbi:MAG TPA: carbon-nitrogen hydrolase family protein [Planctomycetota bacterium]|nr:carbon-nitrogen hydrolase family protein [Planctomycetota bacterium]
MPRLAVAQTVCKVGDVPANLETAASLLAQAGRERADLVCFPELFTTGLVPERTAELAETIPGPSTDTLGRLARACGAFVVAGLLEKDPDGGRFYNSSVLLSPDATLLARYRKVYLYLGERDILTPGREPCVCDVGFGRLALTICYDYVFPQYIQHLVDQGAELLVHSTAWLTTDACEQWRYHPLSYRAMGMTRALENTVFFMSANHAGAFDADGALRAIGQSAIIAPWGEVLAEVGEGQGLAVAHADFSKAPQWRSAAAPYVSDRRAVPWHGQ